MTFPYVAQDSPTQPSGHPPEETTRGDNALREATTVLVAEDDEDIRLMMLTSLGVST